MVKAKTLQIVWHCKEPVFALDFSPTTTNLLATGGADKDIKLWEVTPEPDGTPGVSYVCSLGGVSSPVNALRFSPLGDMLASGGDGGEMMLWRPVEGAGQRALGSSDAEGRAPTWKVLGALRGHGGDVHDLAWAPDGSALISGSVENSAMLWDVEGRRGVGRLEKHQHYVQGVAWDPLGHHVITLSNDRTAQVYGPRPPTLGRKQPTPPPASSAAMLKDLYPVATLSRRIMQDNNDVGQAPAILNSSGATTGAGGAAAPAAPAPVMPAPPARHPLFQDEGLTSFFRRPAWSTDGAFIVFPAGLFKSDPGSPAIPTSYIFSRGDWSTPVAHLPSLGRPSVVVRFSPVLYRLREGEGPGQTLAGAGTVVPPDTLPYRMVWAVGTLDSVMIYDTQSLEPILLVGGLHMAAITDLAWSADGLTLAVSSSDGYCSLVVFEPGELGTPFPPEELPPNTAACVTHAAAKRFAERLAQQQAKKAAGAQAAPNSAAQVVDPSHQTTAPPALSQGASPAATPPGPVTGAKRPAEQQGVEGTPAKRVELFPAGASQACSTAPTPATQPSATKDKAAGGVTVIALDQDEEAPAQGQVAATPQHRLAQTSHRDTPATTGHPVLMAGLTTPASVGRPVSQSGTATPQQPSAGVQGTPSGAGGSAPKRRIVPTAVQPSSRLEGAPSVTSALPSISELAPVASVEAVAVQAAQITSPPAGRNGSKQQPRRIAPVPVTQGAQPAPAASTPIPAAAVDRPAKARITPTPVLPAAVPRDQQGGSASCSSAPVPTSTPTASVAGGTTASLPASAVAPAAPAAGAGAAAAVPPSDAPAPANRSAGGFSIAKLAAMAGRQAAAGRPSSDAA